MFGHNGDDYDEELIAHDSYVLLANDMYQDKFKRAEIMAKLMAMNCDKKVAERICAFIEARERARKLYQYNKVLNQRNVSERNRRDAYGNERRIGISRILDFDDYCREK